MHHLFSLVLNAKDLSKAGDLFSLPDSLIMDDLSEVLKKIRDISMSQGYLQNDNDQSVVEICIARVTATLRDADCIEDHIDALVHLLQTCLNHDLKPLGKDMDPPHAKIASDVLACIFLNYTKRNVMKLALPIAVKFLHKGNKELGRNVSSYLPLAAIEHPDLLAGHIQPIIDSVIGGNYNLTRILPQIYSLNHERMNEHVMALANLLPACDDFEKSCLLNLFKLVASGEPATASSSLLEPSLSQLLDCLNTPTMVVPTLEVFLEMSRTSKLVQERMDTIKDCVTSGSASFNPQACTTAAEVFSKIGLNNKDKASHSLKLLIQLLHFNADQAVQTHILREVVTLSTKYPQLLNSEIINRIEKSANSSTSSTSVSRILIDKVWELYNRRNNNVTIVKINEMQQSSITATPSSSYETSLIKIPTATPSSSSSLLNMNSSGHQFISKSHQNHKNIGFESYKQRSPNINATSNSMNRLNAIPVRYPYVNTSNYSPQTITHQNFNYTGQQHKGLTRLNISGNCLSNISNTPARKRHTPSSSYHNRSACSITGLRDDHHISTVPNLLLNSQSSIPMSTFHITPGNAGHHITTNNHSNWATILSPQPQTQSVFQNYFLANSAGTMSSSASILSNSAYNAVGNYSGSRLLSSTQIPQTPTTPNGHTPNTTLFNKGLSTSPSAQIHFNKNSSITSGNSAPHMYNGNNHHSQPDLRHHRSNGNANNTSVVMIQQEENNRISVFEPFPMRDTVQHFCEKHLDKIKSYMEKITVKIPLPVKCTIEERKSKKNAKLHFSCQFHSENCVYTNNHLFTMKTRNPRAWIHIMFLALQSRSPSALSTREASVSSLKNCWDILKAENKSFLTLVTSAFPSSRDQDALLLELRNSGFFDLFEFNAIKSQWGCFLCNHPERALEFLSSEEPIIEGCLKEKKGKWKLFKRWRTRYFTLSGGQLSARGGDSSSSTLNLHQILSVRVTRGNRNIPKAFEIFTQDKSFMLKPKDGKNANEWVQCLSVLVARKEGGTTGSTSGHYGHYHPNQQLCKGISLNGLRTAV